jgi:hypothetical protein
LTIELLGSGVQGIGDGCDEGSGVGGRAGGGEGGGRDVGMRGVAPVGRGWGGEGWVADVARLRLLDLEGMCLLRVLKGASGCSLGAHTRTHTHTHTHRYTHTHTHCRYVFVKGAPRVRRGGGHSLRKAAGST